MFKRSTLANVCAYVTIIFLVAGTYGANIFAYQMSQNEISSYMDAVDNIAKQASSGGSIYMLLFNPAVTFYAMINQQAGDSDVAGTLERMFGAHPQNFVLEHWTEISIAVQILAAVLLIAAAVAAVTPVWERGRERRRGKDKNSRPI